MAPVPIFPGGPAGGAQITGEGSAAEFAALLGRPVPVPAPPRPFTRTSTAADLATSVVGRRLVALMRLGMKRMFKAEDNKGTDDLVAAVLESMPLRSIAMMAPGVSLGMIDRLVAVLNGDLRGVIRPRG